MYFYMIVRVGKKAYDLDINILMYVCMYAQYVRTVCMYVCMYECMYAQYVCTVCMYVCMYVCMLK